jgi:hypothetical protein
MRPLTLRLGYVFHLARDSQYDLDKRVHPRFRSVLIGSIMSRLGRKAGISGGVKGGCCATSDKIYKVSVSVSLHFFVLFCRRINQSSDFVVVTVLGTFHSKNQRQRSSVIPSSSVSRPRR